MRLSVLVTERHFEYLEACRRERGISWNNTIWRALSILQVIDEATSAGAAPYFAVDRPDEDPFAFLVPLKLPELGQ